MKNLILLFSMILSISSCSKDSEDRMNNNSILGTWKLSSSFINTSLENDGEWKQIENGYKYIFKSDGTFYSDRFKECVEGSYHLTDLKITLIYNCPDFTSNLGENPKGTFVEKYRIEDNELFMSPDYIFCEGCLWKFKRIQE